MTPSLKAPDGQAVLVDGVWYDAETGEALSLDAKPGFQVTDEASADWVLERIMNAETEKARLETKRRAVIENLDRQVADAQRRVDGLHYRFDNELAHYAAGELEGKKTRTLNLAYGRLSFRTVKGGLRVKDQDEALEWARQECPEAVAVKLSFSISAVPEPMKEGLAARLAGSGADDLARRAFELRPDEDRFTVKTGVGAPV